MKIETVAFGGRGVARAEGKVFLVAGALPGEVVEVEVERVRRGVVEARTGKVLTPSPWREATPCPLAGEQCGGCDAAFVAFPWREQFLKESLRGALRGGPAQLLSLVSAAPFHPSPWHYRLRGKLHYRDSQVGFLAPRSARVVAIEPCRVVSPGLVGTLPALAGALAAAGAEPGEVVFLEDLEGKTRLFSFRGRLRRALGPVEGVDGFWQRGGRGWGARTVSLALPIPLEVPLGAFVQVNRFLLPKLFSTVQDWLAQLAPRRFLDLYAGVGFFAAAFPGPSVVVEVNPRAAAAARKNVPQAEVWQTTAEGAIAKGVLRRGDVVMVDPPRGGLSPGVRQALAQSPLRAILYLSCDPACLARDAQALWATGWRAEACELFDLFAGTHHGEILLRFSRGA